MPAMFTYVMHKDIARFAQVATRVWGCEMDEQNPENTARAGIEALRKFLISIGMPKNFAELGAKEEDIPYLVDTLMFNRAKNGIIPGFTALTKADCTNIYRSMV